jgi:hypothetical protein
MYSIVLILLLTSGTIQGVSSQETYPTMEACERALPERIRQITEAGAAHQAWRVMDSKCAVSPDGRPA